MLSACRAGRNRQIWLSRRLQIGLSFSPKIQTELNLRGGSTLPSLLVSVLFSLPGEEERFHSAPPFNWDERKKMSGLGQEDERVRTRRGAGEAPLCMQSLQLH